MNISKLGIKLINKKVSQKRFFSTAMTESSNKIVEKMKTDGVNTLSRADQMKRGIVQMVIGTTVVCAYFNGKNSTHYASNYRVGTDPETVAFKEEMHHRRQYSKHVTQEDKDKHAANKGKHHPDHILDVFRDNKKVHKL